MSSNPDEWNLFLHFGFSMKSLALGVKVIPDLV